MEYKRKMIEAEKGHLKENIINMVKEIDEAKFLKRINVIISDYVKEKPE